MEILTTKLSEASRSKKTTAVEFYLYEVTQSVKFIAIEQTVGTRLGAGMGLSVQWTVSEDRKVLELGGAAGSALVLVTELCPYNGAEGYVACISYHI